MSKKAQILALHEAGHSTRRIAEIVYAIAPTSPWAEADRKMAYVRVVLRQRKGGGPSPSDRTYLLKRYKTRSLAEAWRRRSREERADPARRARAQELDNARRRARRRAEAEART